MIRKRWAARKRRLARRLDKRHFPADLDRPLMRSTPLHYELADRAVVMHGHRHIDWIGECAGVLIVSAPSPVMEVTDGHSTHFYVHSLAAGSDGRLGLLPPQQITLDGPWSAAE